VTANTIELDSAIRRLRSLHDGDLGVADAVICGRRAIAPLRTVLFEREPSGLFETRCRAVQALSALNAREVLVEFLTRPHRAADPVERLGDDAVINATARALAIHRDEASFQVLLKISKERLLPGIVAAIGSFGRPAAIPYLVAGLVEDECRPYAEAALEKLGSRARGPLTEIVNAAASPDGESPSRLRQRQSALRVLVKMANLQANRPGRKHGFIRYGS
jgi:hypothetical protein